MFFESSSVGLGTAVLGIVIAFYIVLHWRSQLPQHKVSKPRSPKPSRPRQLKSEPTSGLDEASGPVTTLD